MAFRGELSKSTTTIAFRGSVFTYDDDDLEGLAEPLALDEEEEQEGSREVLSKSQRIVLEFSNENAKRVINDNEYVLVLVLGYPPWCPRSTELMP
ncbi:hypothetical protein HHK36_001819 [Tetracentron sinense]|uniref:Uncharacterized protein n=1 Tax=Tetracentron sinense TaxID=13715 RepID=A0A834ZU18_TETSI|nr:hypothetical protein HHK36_001819 [Tetracentron sinense]